jgi:hypothetical protein
MTNEDVLRSEGKKAVHRWGAYSDYGNKLRRLFKLHQRAVNYLLYVI